MYRLILALAILLGSGTTQTIKAEDASTQLAPTESSLCNFDYQGFTIKVPSGIKVDITPKEAILKADTGDFGMSIKVEPDKKATPSAAFEMCRRMITDLDVKGASLNRVTLHGLSGGRLEGITEGAPIALTILDGGDCYLKVVIIATPEKAGLNSLILDSISRIGQ